jgi:hypothetical protein
LLDIYWNILTMHGPINVKSPNNISKWQMGFNSAFKGLNIGRSLMSHKRRCVHTVAWLPTIIISEDQLEIFPSHYRDRSVKLTVSSGVTKLYSLSTAPKVFKAPCLTKYRNNSVLTSTTSSRKVALSEQRELMKEMKYS